MPSAPASQSLNLTRPVVMVGMMGAGKTAIGQAVARLLGVPFRDSDAALVKAANMEISEIFERDGESFFRARETEVIERLLGQGASILSTGGGAFMSEHNREMISQMGVSVWLKADLDLLWNRVKHKDTRPLLRTSDPFQTLSDIFAEREPIYQKADLFVEAMPHYSIEDMAEAVLQTLKDAGIVK